MYWCHTACVFSAFSPRFSFIWLWVWLPWRGHFKFAFFGAVFLWLTISSPCRWSERQGTSASWWTMPGLWQERNSWMHQIHWLKRHSRSTRWPISGSVTAELTTFRLAVFWRVHLNESSFFFWSCSGSIWLFHFYVFCCAWFRLTRLSFLRWLPIITAILWASPVLPDSSGSTDWQVWVWSRPYHYFMCSCPKTSTY